MSANWSGPAEAASHCRATVDSLRRLLARLEGAESADPTEMGQNLLLGLERHINLLLQAVDAAEAEDIDRFEAAMQEGHDLTAMVRDVWKLTHE